MQTLRVQVSVGSYSLEHISAEMSHTEEIATTPAFTLCLANIRLSVDKFIAGNQLPHMLFYGPPGTGKTSTILCVARKIYGDKAAGKAGGNYRNNVLEVSTKYAYFNRPCLEY